MTTNSKMAAAGLAILLAGTAIGWGASRMPSRGPAGNEPQATAFTSLPSAQEQIPGNLTPQTQYQPPATRRAVTKIHSAIRDAGIRVPAGTPVVVAVNTSLSTKTAGVGDSWSGTVTEPVFAGGREVIPAGSYVRGVVLVAQPAQRGDRATLQLAMRSISIAGRSYPVRGSSEAVVAGSPRVRNVGAIAGGAAAGVLLGKAIGHSAKSTVIGAVLGGGAATAAVVASHGYQATIPAGRTMEFTTGSSMTVRA